MEIGICVLIVIIVALCIRMAAYANQIQRALAIIEIAIKEDMHKADRIGKLEPNAKRYLWLRNHAGSGQDHHPMVCTGLPSSSDCQLIHLNELDDAVDAAMEDAK